MNLTVGNFKIGEISAEPNVLQSGKFASQEITLYRKNSKLYLLIKHCNPTTKIYQQSPTVYELKVVH